jgi:hypothetical protein
MTPEQLDNAKKYTGGERATRAAIAEAWRAMTNALAQEAAFAGQIQRGEFGEEMGAYYADQVAQFDGADAHLRTAMGQAKAIIEALQNAAPGNLFPGVPKQGDE